MNLDNNQKLKIILLNYQFPPYAGVGGFRWAKLSKYLSKLGVIIHVITIKWKKYNPNTFIDDVLNNENIIIHKIPSGYPHNIFTQNSKNYTNYISLTFARFIVILKKLYHRVFNIYDQASKWDKYLIPYCENLIKKEKINIVIATGAPFMTNVWAAKIKERNPHITLIQDFRDAWAKELELANEFNLANFSNKEISHAFTLQNYSVKNADKIVSVTKMMLNTYITNYPNKKSLVIDNGYDPLEFTTFNTNNNTKPKFTITYLGSIFNNRDMPLKILLDTIKNIIYTCPDIKIIIIGNISNKILKSYKNLIAKNVLQFMPFMPYKKAIEFLISNTTYALHLNAKRAPHALSTKIYEYAFLKIPTISLNYGGEIEEFINEHDIGYSINLEKADLKNFLINLYDNPFQHKFKFKDIDQYSYEKLAKKYLDFILNK